MDDIIPVKVVLVGDPGVGKTCIIQRYVNNSYSEINESTISSTYTNKVLEFKEYDKKLCQQGQYSVKKIQFFHRISGENSEIIST